MANGTKLAAGTILVAGVDANIMNIYVNDVYVGHVQSLSEVRLLQWAVDIIFYLSDDDSANYLVVVICSPMWQHMVLSSSRGTSVQLIKL